VTRAFITGIGGQDGGYLAERLLAEGVEVHALAHDQEPPPRVPGVELHSGDLTRTDEVRALLLDLSPDEVYNLAAISSVARSWDQPDLTAQVNGTAAVALMESALQVQDKRGSQVRFVQASSAEIFGQPEVPPQDETTAIRPVNPAPSSTTTSPPGGRPPSSPARSPPPRPPSHGAGRSGSPSATSTPGATGAGRPTTSMRWSGPPGPTNPATSSSPPA
jgi:hypothetical protein